MLETEAGAPLSARQNRDQEVGLLCAAHVAYGRALLFERLGRGVAWVLAGAAVVASMVDGIALPLGVASVIGVLVGSVFLPLASRAQVGRAALLQEAFDIEVFGMAWDRQLGPRPTPEAVSLLARRFKGPTSAKHDWYLTADGVPAQVEVLMCQRQNLRWDTRTRRTQAWLDAAVAATWVLIGLGIALAADWTVRELVLRWLVPSLPLVVGATIRAAAHLEVVGEKERLVGLMEADLERLARDGDQAALAARCRSYQSDIARMRSRALVSSKVLYERRRAEDQVAARAAIDEMVARITAHGPLEGIGG